MTTLPMKYLHMLCCSTGSRKPNETMRILLTTFFGVVFGFLIGVSFPTLSLTKVGIQFLKCLCDFFFLFFCLCSLFFVLYGWLYYLVYMLSFSLVYITFMWSLNFGSQISHRASFLSLIWHTARTNQELKPFWALGLLWRATIVAQCKHQIQKINPRYASFLES